MKKTLLLMTLVLTLIACQDKTDTPIDYVVISGTISNTKGGELKVSSLNGFSKSMNVKDIGTFTDTLYIEEDGIYNLRFGAIRIAPYMSKGGNISISVDEKDPLKSLKYSGEYSDLNNYYAYKASKEYEFSMNREASFNIDEAAFEAKIKGIQEDFEQKFGALTNVPESVIEKEKRALNYSRLAKKSSYERMYGYLNKNFKFKASDAFKRELADIALNNSEDYLYSSDYQQMVGNELRQKTMAYYQNDSLPYPQAQAKSISDIENEVIRNAELYKAIPMTLTRSNKKDEDLASFLSASTNDKHKAKIKELYETLKALDAGQPSPKFENFENYEGGTTSLNDLKGKYVYIDVWATWCGPCKYEIPFLQKVEEKYHDENIHFVSLSVDKQKDKEVWKKMVADKEMGGIQIISDNDFNTPFVQGYKIMGIPQFILLDPEGNIVRANAPRPSDEKLIELFNTLNI